jgi:predicted dehydrogenase/threonine dehydrogenase-like Zn-dependent dehydrogenase
VKQVLQDVRSGEIAVHDVPEPMPHDGFVLVGVKHSLISAGTERASAELGAKSLLQKARARPDLVRKVVDTARSEGVATAIEKVRTRLDQYSAFGYSASGEVLDAGGDPRFGPGALVACIGAGYASHAAVDSVPSNLVIPLPEGVESADGAFAAPAAIALHAIRLAEVGPGSVVAVVGLGLIGQLAARLLEASGCTVVGTDPRADRRASLAHAADAAEVPALIASISRGRGADAVIVTAATSSDGPVELSAELARDRAKVVVVGDVGLGLSRRVFYDKELSLVVARSYGPGRYVRAYEERGHDFPIGYVRWTESRNVEAVLDLIAAGRLRVDDLVTHRYPVDEAVEAYGTLESDQTTLGVLLEYVAAGDRRPAIELRPRAPQPGALRTALVGAGNFMRGTLVPALQSASNVELVSVTARSGAGAKALGDRIEASTISTDWRAAVAADDIDAVVIATPHAMHAEMTAAALAAGKATFVEKPLALDADGLAQVAAAARDGGLLLVGHNRRFAPLAARLRAELRGPLLITIRVAAGALPAEHWLNDAEHGGRVLGEISHFVDFASYLVGSPPTSVSATTVSVSDHEESLSGTLQFADGSVATIAYGVGPAAGLAKERVEVFGSNGAAVLHDFARLDLHLGRQETVKAKRDKGHAAQVEAFVRAARGETGAPVPVGEQLLVAAASIALLDAARIGAPVDVVLPG